MNLRSVVILALCLTIMVTPASSASLLAAAAAVKGAVVGAGLTALKSRGGSETLIIQSKPGSVVEVVPANQITVQDLGDLHTTQTITYASRNPISRLWETVSNAVAAKAKAIGDIFRPSHNVVIVVPQTTEKTTTKETTTVKTTTEKTTTEKTTTEKQAQVIIQLKNNPSHWQTIEVVEPSPSRSLIGFDLGNKPRIDVELNHKPLPTIGLSGSIGSDSMFRRIQPMAFINYGKK